MTSKFLIRPSDVATYQPANHSKTHNQRLISQHNVGAQHIEVILGTLEQNGAALPHAHPGIEQVCYLLEGTAHVRVADEAFDMQPGDTCFFPADVMHSFEVTSKTPVKLLVIYSPPYDEKPENVRR
jgi:mannose-6-phosphate isomerase-like protein (cupin superfamily)